MSADLTPEERDALARTYSLGEYPRVLDKVVAAVERIVAARERAAEVRALREAAAGYDGVLRSSASFGGMWLRDRAEQLEADGDGR